VRRGSFDSHVWPGPTGRRVAFTRFRSDDRQVAIWDLDTNRARVIPLSFYDCTWWDDDHLILKKGGELRLLDLAEDRESQFSSRLKLLETIRPAAADHLALVKPETPAGRSDGRHVFWDIGDPQVVGDRLYLVLTIGVVGSGVFSLDRSLANPLLHGWFDFAGVSEYRVLGESNAIWADIHGTGDLGKWQEFAGLGTSDLAGIWRPISEWPTPWSWV
jgi:hypothetical protein